MQVQYSDGSNTYVPNNYGLALSQRRDGDSSFYLADGTQDVRQLTDSVQSLTDEYEFDALGNSLSSTGGTPNAQQYKGQQLAYRADPDAGPELQYALHFRQYVSVHHGHIEFSPTWG